MTKPPNKPRKPRRSRKHRATKDKDSVTPEDTKKYPPIYRVYKKFFSAEACETILWNVPWVEWRQVPKWLGNFNFCIYGKGKAILPAPLQTLVDRMKTLVPEQKFNTTFLQKYEKGQFVKAHRDPRNNLGYTVLAIFGEFTGAESIVGKKRLQLMTGDVLVQRCNIEGLQRPLHRVSEVTSGTRYALILNTIN